MTNDAPKLDVSNATLLKQFIIAWLIAGFLWLAVVMPAEYQLDPLSTGKLLGLDVMSAASLGLDESEVEIKDDLTTFRLAVADGPLVSTTKQITIDGYEGIELKALMKQGDGFTYSWHTEGGALYTDMHGERLANSEEFESYLKNKAMTKNQGTFVAPFEGTHGWYWQNMQEEPITVTVEISGFFNDLHTK